MNDVRGDVEVRAFDASPPPTEQRTLDNYYQHKQLFHGDHALPPEIFNSLGIVDESDFIILFPPQPASTLPTLPLPPAPPHQRRMATNASASTTAPTSLRLLNKRSFDDEEPSIWESRRALDRRAGWKRQRESEVGIISVLCIRRDYQMKGTSTVEDYHRSI